MRLVLAALFFIACNPETEQSADPDLSRYALQADLDAALVEIDELREQVADASDASIRSVGRTTGNCSYSSPGEASFTDRVQVIAAHAGEYDEGFGWTWRDVRYTTYQPDSDDEGYATKVMIRCADLDTDGEGTSEGFEVVYATIE